MSESPFCALFYGKKKNVLTVNALVAVESAVLSRLYLRSKRLFSL